MNLFKRVVSSAKKKNFTRTKDRVMGACGVLLLGCIDTVAAAAGGVGE